MNLHKHLRSTHDVDSTIHLLQRNFRNSLNLILKLNKYTRSNSKYNNSMYILVSKLIHFSSRLATNPNLRKHKPPTNSSSVNRQTHPGSRQISRPSFSARLNGVERSSIIRKLNASLRKLGAVQTPCNLTLRRGIDSR